MRYLKGIDVLSLTPRKHNPDPWTRGHLAPFSLERGNGLVGASCKKTQALFTAHGFCLCPPFLLFKEKGYFHVFYFGAVGHNIFTGHFPKWGTILGRPSTILLCGKKSRVGRGNTGKGVSALPT